MNNCDKCTNDATKGLLCNQCKRGTFLYNNTCVAECPQGYRADRITWSCLQPPVFSWYWVYPSKSSCKDKCNSEKTENTDCSCSNNCVTKANCCPDYDFYCIQSKKRKNDLKKFKK